VVNISLIKKHQKLDMLELVKLKTIAILAVILLTTLFTEGNGAPSDAAFVESHQDSPIKQTREKIALPPDEVSEPFNFHVRCQQSTLSTGT
jgi:hypothetical protein